MKNLFSLTFIVIVIFGTIGCTQQSIPGTDATPSPSATSSIDGSTPNSELVTIKGVLDCLPKKSNNGQQTEECAYGIKSDDGTYYGFDFEGKDVTMDFGKKLEVTGNLVDVVDSTYSINSKIVVKNYKQI
ncbi:MAG: hypothetical protein M3P33_01875 [bacterium]|nr:hypothetical protein [bacterium]